MYETYSEQASHHLNGRLCLTATRIKTKLSSAELSVAEIGIHDIARGTTSHQRLFSESPTLKL